MPGRHPDAGIRILERLVLEPARLEPERTAEREQPLLVGAHEVHHRLVLDSVPVKPNAAAQGESHPLAAALEFPIRRVLGEGIRPSNSTHCRLVWEWTARADQPPGVAVTMVSVTPVDELKLFSDARLLV